ncbi:MAG: hypothetical protein H6679_01060 [Epsilonproteobacteria bacterium]|nr:hypothetical protein [Campylobacterota bacterium]
MKKIILTMLVLLVSLINLPALYSDGDHVHTWTLLVYADASDNLQDAIIKNIRDLAASWSHPCVEIRIQVSLQAGYAWRYIVVNNQLREQEFVQLDSNQAENLINFTNWGFKNSIAAHHGLILSGHGYGILDPSYHELENDWFAESDQDLPCGICKDTLDQAAAQHYRATLLNRVTQNYLNNKEMVSTLHNIKSMLNKKLDLFCLDMCLGASLEHAYQVAPYVDILIGCQNCELKDGFDFFELGRSICSSGNTPANLARKICQAYHVYYEQHAERGIYTLAAIDCSYASSIKDSLDVIAHALVACIQQDSKLKTTIRDVRLNCINFCFVPMYTDLFMVCSEYEKILPILEKHSVDKNTLQTLKDELDNCKHKIHNAVIANVKGHSMGDAHGMSIYFPFNHIDSSYKITEFGSGKPQAWVGLLETVVR